MSVPKVYDFNGKRSVRTAALSNEYPHLASDLTTSFAVNKLAVDIQRTSSLTGLCIPLIFKYLQAKKGLQLTARSHSGGNYVGYNFIGLG
jgi:hypothetical protein